MCFFDNIFEHIDMCFIYVNPQLHQHILKTILA